MDNETKRLYERALEITPKKLEKTLHEPLQYDNRHEHIMRTIERMAGIS